MFIFCCIALVALIPIVYFLKIYAEKLQDISKYSQLPMSDWHSKVANSNQKNQRIFCKSLIRDAAVFYINIEEKSLTEYFLLLPVRKANPANLVLNILNKAQELDNFSNYNGQTFSNLKEEWHTVSAEMYFYICLKTIKLQMSDGEKVIQQILISSNGAQKPWK